MNRHAALPDVAWYLVQCKPRQDARALEHLQRQGFECFCPFFQAQVLRGGKVRPVRQLLFPGYLFLRMHLDDSWLSLRSTRGVSRVVSFCGMPCRVDDGIVEHLALRCEQAPAATAFTPGERVQVRLGPFADMEAIFLSMDGEERVMLLLNLLNREQQVPVRLADIQAVRDRRTDIPIL